jgi:IS5 family transposase
MIKARRLQQNFGDGFIQEEAGDLWPPWMQEADRLLEDETLVQLVWKALSQRCQKSKTRGRPATTAEVILRMLVLKHSRNWSFVDTVQEVRANLVYRQFTRVGGSRVPHNKTLSRVARQLGPEVMEKIHQRLVTLAQDKKVIRGKKLRVDTTVVETNIHYPTDSSLLNDGVRVLTRVMQQVNEIAGKAGTQARNRTRSIKLRLLEIARASRDKSQKGQEKLKTGYRKLLEATKKVVGQAQRVAQEILEGVKLAVDPLGQAYLQGAEKELNIFIPRVQQVIQQTQTRIFAGNNHAPNKLVSIFEPETEIIRRGKASKPTEFGKMIKIQEAERQIVTHYEVYEHRPSDSDLLLPALEEHQRRLGRIPDLAAADTGFFSAHNETQAHKLGVKQVAIPCRGTKSPARRQRQKSRWFKKAQKWRTGCEGRISVLKRRHGLDRCRYKGPPGMKRWVGLGVIADTVINIGAYLADQRD